MQRSRLRNIINKSKQIYNPTTTVGEPYDEFLKSLPKELIYNENYRMKDAWKAYGSPKNYSEALWEGLIQPIDENIFKLPSIGYNEETGEYEYLNKGKENDIVAKDIRVWDNDVIPLVKELKLGGFIRQFNEEKDCWVYTKNSQKEAPMGQDQGSIQQEVGNEINFFKKGGKPKRSEIVLMLYANNSGVPFIKRILSKDVRSVQIPGEKYPSTHLLSYKESDGNTSYVFPQVMEDEKGNLKWYGDEAFNRALETKDYLEMTPEEAEWFTTHYKEYYPEYFGKFENGGELEAFKQGGQMSVIPEGALHAHKNHMEGAGEDFTEKGIPVIDNKGEQQAEIERNEIIFRKEVTDKIEELYKKYKEEESTSKKDEIAIEMGKILTCEITKHTEDRTGLIEQVQEKM